MSIAIKLQSEDLLIQQLTPKVFSVWNALESRYANEISANELDHIFALFVLGLTTPLLEDGEPARHLDVCNSLLSVQLSPERVRRALHSVPRPSAHWVGNACRSIEELGAKDGRLLRDQVDAERKSTSIQSISIHDTTPSPAGPAPIFGGNNE